ncbi:MAG: phosphatidate cytidylyltransferase [Ruminococcaceae bacterium]|nr:phosphatidate cytidylyltransferase [Oscillospiraceae bacterium]
MKQRLISIAAAFVLLAAALVWFDTLVPNIMMAAIAALAVFEVLRAYKLHENLFFDIAFISFAVTTVVFELATKPYFSAMLAGLIFVVFTVALLSKKKKYTVAALGAVLLATLTVSLGFNALLFPRTYTPYVGDWRFMLLIALALGWIGDTCAFFTGRAFGKRKLCPEISPNKTVAGAIGSIVGTPLFIVASFFVYSVLDRQTAFGGFKGDPLAIGFVFLMGVIGAVVGMLGDLAASYIKRECGIKDFGNIMPGHGGAMDRIDSVMFTGVFSAACFYLYFTLFVAF